MQNYITAILIFLVVEEAMTWGFYGMLLYNCCIGYRLTYNRLPKQSWLKRIRKGFDDHRSHP